METGAFLLTDSEYSELDIVDVERVAEDKDSGFLVAFVRDDTGEFLRIFSTLQERKRFPWKFKVEFEEGKGYLEFFVIITIAKPELSTFALRIKFKVNRWVYAKERIAFFFFAERKGERFINPEGILVSIPESLISYCERRIEDFEIDLFYDKVLKLGNPYSPQYVEGVWTSFVENRYRPA